MAEMVDTTIREALRDVYDPCCREKGISIVDMGLLHHADLEDGVAHVELLLTSGWCPFATTVLTETESAVRALPGVTDASVAVVWTQAWSPERLSDDARDRLRFLPDPVAVDDPVAYAREQTSAGGS